MKSLVHLELFFTAVLAVALEATSPHGASLAPCVASRTDGSKLEYDGNAHLKTMLAGFAKNASTCVTSSLAGPTELSIPSSVTSNV